MERGWREPFGLIAVAVLLLAVLEFAGPGLLRHLEYGFNDLLLRSQAAQRQPDGDIVLLDIDESSLARMAPEQGRYPWARSVHAEVVEWIARQRPKAIIFDILFSDPDPLRPDDDNYLAEVAASHDNLYLPLVKLHTDQPGIGLPLAEFGRALGFIPTGTAEPDARAALLLPYMALALDGRLGVINFEEQSDGVGRHYPLYLEADGWRLPSLPAQVASGLGHTPPPQPRIRLNWQGPAMSYPRVSYADIYEDLSRREPQRPADEFRDRIVLIGSTATAQHDLRTTPVGSLQPALEIIATALDNLRHDDYLRDVPAWLPPLVTLLLISSLWFAFRRGIGALPIGTALLLTTPLLFALAYLALGRGWWLPLLTPVLFAWSYYALAALYAYRQAQQERQRSVQIFSRFLDPRVVQDLVSHGDSALNIKPQSRQITVLFSDIRGFTTLSERHSAEEIVELLNDYFSRQVQVIFAHGGTMDKFIGDAIMAFWGAPVDDVNQAHHAVAAALEMADTLRQFKHDLGAADENFDVGIGIHTGPGVVGFIGSENRLDYTAIGDTVNLASRIEGQTKGVARILVSAETRALCDTAFDFVDHGFYKVKGRSAEVRLYEPRRKSP
ncbi:MAG: adenylate/guanylate cyclase domain-containing protein [Gammaproteobacteria bacterium]|nr:adenylate/guanylate cyclase domain-containing protein [Gammaproteobacteria bacterium]MCW8992594.1 adenylate/guanylate cyclase domain-containing protein [Gammaproteobacteria bacterium]